MGILKRKPILFSGNFAHSTDPFYADNTKYKAIREEQIPNDDKNLVVKKAQAVFFTVDNILEKLLNNDKYINTYIQKLQNTSVPIESVTQAFKQNIAKDELSSSIFETAYSNHLSVHHNRKYICPDGNKFEQLDDIYNKRLRTDFSNFDIDAARGEDGEGGTFLHKSDRIVDSASISLTKETSYNQDVILNLECDDFVDCPTNFIAIYVCNEYTGNKFSTTLSKNTVVPVSNQIPSTTQSKYIYREWLSGMKEFFIYIPSTFTFYNENPDIINQDPHSKCTWIKMIINKRHFKINHIYHMEIAGQSLPLQIHSNDISYFNDCPQPSIIRSLCISDSLDNNVNCVYDEETNMMTLYFCCYGTDAQAIKILAK